MFHRCKTKAEGQSLFRKLAKILHPDTGGDNECFILLKETYEMFIEVIQIGENKYEETPKVEPVGDPKKYENTSFDVDINDPKLEIIADIKIYAENHKRFNTSYVESLEEYLDEHGHLTEAQYNSLVKIYYSFRMDKKNYEKKGNDPFSEFKQRK